MTIRIDYHEGRCVHPLITIVTSLLFIPDLVRFDVCYELDKQLTMNCCVFINPGSESFVSYQIGKYSHSFTISVPTHALLGTVDFGIFPLYHPAELSQIILSMCTHIVCSNLKSNKYEINHSYTTNCNFL